MAAIAIAMVVSYPVAAKIASATIVAASGTVVPLIRVAVAYSFAASAFGSAVYAVVLVLVAAAFVAVLAASASVPVESAFVASALASAPATSASASAAFALAFAPVSASVLVAFGAAQLAR